MAFSRSLTARWLLLTFTLLLVASLNTINLHAQTTTDTSPARTTFSFTLDEPCKTSAGVYKTDGTLVRTLWSKVRYYATGTHTTNWDGLDDNGNSVPPGIYQIKLLEHNTEYVWDGAIGNTSTTISGPTVHHGFFSILDMTITGTNAFYCSGYNESQSDFRSFCTTDPQQVTAAWVWDYDRFGLSVGNNPTGTYDRNWAWTTADTNWVYFACSAAYDPITGTNNTFPGFIVASKVSDNSLVYFTNGIPIPNGPLTIEGNYPNGIYVGTQPGLSGLSVQRNGKLLAASVAPDNKVYLLDKHSGAAITNFIVPSPGRLNFSPDGSLWVCSSNSVVLNFTNLNVNPSLAHTISGLSEPLDVAVNPTNADIILVADGGSSQQVKAFNNFGASLWTYGLVGGYPSNGVAVANNKFWFTYEGIDETFICFAPDGSFWVGDAANHRDLHFDSDRNYLEQIMYQPLSHSTCVDQNNPSRVFNQFLEFAVDYAKPLGQSWTLKNNWKVNVDTNHITGLDEGILGTTDFSNGRTFALVNNVAFGNANSTCTRELCELGPTGLRCTAIFPMLNSINSWNSFGADGSGFATAVGQALWYESSLSGFDTNNNPVWNPEKSIASAPEGSTDPYPRSGSFGQNCTTISSNNVLISLDASRNNGWHLGGIRLGSTNWLWRASPVGNLNGLGNYEISNGLQYAGNLAQAVDRNVVYGFHGEFFRSQAEAGQYMHYYDDGLFVGQFGESSITHSAYEGSLPGFAGNNYCPSLIKATNGEYYVWDNDESGHGPQRWHLVNARNIREQSGTGNLGGAIALTQPVVNFPTGVTGQLGSNSVELSWLPVPGASTYNVYYSLVNGGPYQTPAGSTPATNCFITGLTNGQTYYFAVTAVVGGKEGCPSEQLALTPFDTSQSVLGAGSDSEGEQLEIGRAHV